MAKYWLINSVLLQTGKKLPGDAIDDTIDNVAQIRSAGGVLWPYADSIVADAAAAVQVARLNKAVNEQDMSNRMNAACDDSTLLRGQNKSPNIFQNEWHIDPTRSNNNGSGKTKSAALKTWAELVDRLGLGSTLNPDSGFLTITIWGDLPVTDPVIWDFVMAPNCSYRVTGQKTQLASGTITDVTPYDGETTGWMIKDNSKGVDFFETYVGKSVEIYQGAAVGAKANIARNMNQASPPVPKTAHMSEWVISEFPDLYQAPTPPAVNDKYKIYKYTTVTIARISHSAAGLHDPSAKGGNAQDGAGYWTNLTPTAGPDWWQDSQITVENTFMYFWNCYFPNNGGALVAGGSGPGKSGVGYENCSMHAIHRLDVANGEFMFGNIGERVNGGGLNIGRGSAMLMGGHPVIANAVLNLFDGGYLETGAISFWNCVEPVIAGPSIYGRPHWVCTFQDPALGEVGHVPYFGTGNEAFLWGKGSLMSIYQYQDGPVGSTPVKLPMCDAVFKVWDFSAVIRDDTKLHPLDSDGNCVTAVEFSDSDYANLAVASPAGFRDYTYNDSGPWGAYRSYQAHAHKPQLAIDIMFHSEVFEAP